MDAMWGHIACEINDSAGRQFSISRVKPLSGGCINQAWLVSGERQQYFVKTHASDGPGMFEAEYAGLKQLADARVIRVPRPICVGHCCDQAFLVLEYIESAPPQPHSHRLLGSQLAALHQIHAQQFGWRRDNTIGTTRQINHFEDDWAEFWRRHRLEFQLELAYANGHCKELQGHGDLLLERLPLIFAGQRCLPSLVHGDLWSGNLMFDAAGQPVLYDPAVYFADSETDIAMTELFGGFTADFYRSYRALLPEQPGDAQRRELYRLYHVLNHLNLFGGGYLQQARQLMDRLCAELAG
ncbi:MAG: fructosamine kinase family protein [Gammaproteobacteria bacterium]|nr:fructosamine kinase family protein [Gammaproteobacteria bacterium]